MKSLVLAIVLLLLNWGLIPERNTMNTCVEISEQAATELARPELVVDFNGDDFTPTPTFLRIMNAAHKHLDRRFSHETLNSVTRLPLAQGQWWLDAPAGLKYITRIDLEDAAGNIVPNGGLDRRTLAFLRDRYGQTFDLVPEGQPQEWARADARSRTVPLPWGTPVPFGTEFVVNGEFSTDTDWALSSASIAGGVLTGSGPFSVTSSATLALEAGTHTFKMDVTDPGGTSISVQLAGSATVTVLALTANPGTGTITAVVTIATPGAYTLLLSGGGALVIDNVSLRDQTFSFGWMYAPVGPFEDTPFAIPTIEEQVESVSFYSEDIWLQGQKFKLDFTSEQENRPTGLYVQFALITLQGDLVEVGVQQIVKYGESPLVGVDIEYANLITVTPVSEAGYYTWTGLLSAVSMAEMTGEPNTYSLGLLTMPPADQAYTAVVHHAAYASPWVENSDVSWWSDKHPDILVLAIKRQVELELNRNSTGVKDYDGTLELALFDVETDAAMESHAGRPETFRFGWRP